MRIKKLIAFTLYYGFGYKHPISEKAFKILYFFVAALTLTNGVPGFASFPIPISPEAGWLPGILTAIVIVIVGPTAYRLRTRLHVWSYEMVIGDYHE